MKGEKNRWSMEDKRRVWSADTLHAAYGVPLSTVRSRAAIARMWSQRPQRRVVTLAGTRPAVTEDERMVAEIFERVRRIAMESGVDVDVGRLLLFLRDNWREIGEAKQENGG